MTVRELLRILTEDAPALDAQVIVYNAGDEPCCYSNIAVRVVGDAEVIIEEKQ